MSKLSDKQIVIFSVLLFTLTYITIHTDIFSNFLDVIHPFINGFILAYLTDILAVRVEAKMLLKWSKKRWVRGLSVLLVYLLFAGVLAILLTYIVPILFQNVQLLMVRLPEYLNERQLPIPTFTNFFGNLSLLELTTRYGGDLWGFTGYARAATSGVVNGVLSFVISVYVLLTKEGIFKFTKRLGMLIIPNHVNALGNLIQRSHIVFQQFLIAQLLASAILGILAGMVLYFLGVSYAILIGAIIGLSNIIPLFGAIVGIVISMLIMFLSNPPMLAWASLAFLLLLQQVDATIITPKLMGNVLNLNPIIVIFAMILGTSYFGFIGILFAVPVTVILREVAREKLR